MDTRDKGMIQVSNGTEWESMRFHHATYNSVQFNHNYFNSGIFHVIFLAYSSSWVPETEESKTTDKGALLYMKIISKKDPEKLVTTATSRRGNEWLGHSKRWMLSILKLVQFCSICLCHIFQKLTKKLKG